MYISRLSDDGNGRLRYLVRDNGPGIPDDYLDDVFLPFFRGEKGATGIGLATVAKIADVYDGEVKAYNEDGACFEITLSDYRPES
jgi:signal transduction histidine kinase